MAASALRSCPRSARMRARARSAPPSRRRCRSRRVISPAVVAVRGHRRSFAASSPGRSRRCSRARSAAAGDQRVEAIDLRLEAVQRELLLHPVGGAERARRAGRAVRVVVRELPRELSRGDGVERGWERRRRQRCGRPTVNAASSSGNATSSHVPRTIRALIGRSTEPRRGGAPAKARSSGRRHGQAV